MQTKVTRKYSDELLKRLTERQVTREINGVEVLVKRLPDSDAAGEMDARLYKGMKPQLAAMKLMPKSMLKLDGGQKSIEKLRKMFNGIKSIPISTAELDIQNTTIKAEDGHDVPIRIYQPKDVGKGNPILLYMHGGGFFAGSPDVVDEAMRMICENEKIPIVSVGYRLAPENPYPRGHKDCFVVLKWLYASAEGLGGDNTKIFVGGDSAGGNLALYCSLKDKEQGTKMVRGQLLLYPTVNMGGVRDELSEWSIDKYEIAPKHKSALEAMLTTFGGADMPLGEILGVGDTKNSYLTPYMANLAGLPTTFLTVGEHDFLRVEVLAFAAKLKKAEVATKTILYSGFGHAYIDNIGVYPQSEDCAIEMGRFMRETCEGE